MKRERGVALILVLMVTGVLGLLILQISLTAKEHTRRAQRLVDRVNADLGLRSADAALLFALATHEWGGSREHESSDEHVRNWRFDGTPFVVGGARIQIQDLSGLVPIPQPGTSVRGFERILQQVGMSSDRARAAVDQLESMQSPPDFIPLQDFHEFAVIGGMAPGEIRRLEAASTLYPTRFFNPATAPTDALAARFSGSVLQGLLALREKDRLDPISFFSLTGEGGDDSISFYPVPALGLRLWSTRERFRQPRS